MIGCRKNIVRGIEMLDFYNNTYIVTEDDLPEVLEHLKTHPEYKGFISATTFMDNKCGIEQYDSLWYSLNFYFSITSGSVCLTNNLVTPKMIQSNPDIVKVARIHVGIPDDEHGQQSLLTALMQLDKQVMRFD